MISLPIERAVFFASVSVDSLSGFALLPEEAKSLSPKASEFRRRQFIMGRAACHKALKELGTDGPLLRGAHGEPCWPDGIVGSLSHTDNMAIAGVASKTDVFAFGIDVEDTTRVLRSDISSRIALPDELKWVKESPGDQRIKTYMLFSAKECVYKALFPISHKYIGFRDALLQWNSKENTFDFTLLIDINETIKKGFKCKIRCIIEKNLILSYLLLRRQKS